MDKITWPADFYGQLRTIEEGFDALLARKRHQRNELDFLIRNLRMNLSGRVTFRRKSDGFAGRAPSISDRGHQVATIVRRPESAAR